MSRITIKDIITNSDNLPKINKFNDIPNIKNEKEISQILMNRLIDLNENRTNKIDSFAELLGCEVIDMHIHNHTCDAIVIDKQTNNQVRVIIPRGTILAFCKTYPMEDIRFPVIIKYLCSRKDYPLRYNSKLYVHYYRYLSWLKSTWNGYCNKKGC